MRKFSIGRSSQNDIVINDRTDMVSRFHADLFMNPDGTCTLTDHSTHGTTVNGQMLHNSSRQVRYGDSIMFANAAQFDWSSTGAGAGGSNVPFTPPTGNGTYQKPMAPYAVAAMVLGILSLVVPYVGLALGIIGLCLAVSGLKRTKYDRERYRGIGMLKAGLICSIISVAAWALALILALVAGAAFLGGLYF